MEGGSLWQQAYPDMELIPSSENVEECALARWELDRIVQLCRRTHPTYLKTLMLFTDDYKITAEKKATQIYHLRLLLKKHGLMAA